MKSITKVVIVGAGAVGSTVAYSLVVNGVAAEIVLIDINKCKAQGEVWDMQHSMEFQKRNVRICVGDYDSCKDADIVIITASAPYNGETNRLMTLDKTALIIKEIVPNVTNSGFDGIFIVVSNPVDCMSYMVKELSGFPKNRVIGTGTILETARLKQIIGDIMGMNLKSIDAYVMGEHGDSMMIPWSHVRAGGKNFSEIITDNPERMEGISLDNIVDITKKAGYHVLQSKGNTQYGIAGAVAGLVTAILHDESKLYAVSAYLEGEYGLSGIFCGVPVIIGREGIREIGNFNLSSDEMLQLRQSADVIHEYITKLDKYLPQ
jgi:L-lactate dehydrogenase